MTEKRLEHGKDADFLWAQLYEILKKDIVSGKYQKGSKLPTEKEIMATYDVSRITVREAMNKLLSEGLIERTRGRGTTVAANQEKYGTMLSTYEGHEIHNRNDRRVISAKYVNAPIEAAYFFQIPEAQPVLCLTRESYLNGRVVTRYETYLSSVTGLTADMDFSGSLYEKLRKLGYPVTDVTEKITAKISDAEMKNIFHLKKNEAVIQRIRMGSSEKIPVEYTVSWYLSDGYELTIHRKY